MRHSEEFTLFYEARRDEIYRAVAVTLGDAVMAEDAVEEAFVRAVERWPTVRNHERPAGWVFRVAVNWATSWRRKLALRPIRSAESLDRAHCDQVPNLDLADQLRQLPPAQRQALVLRHGLGFSVEETASLLGVASGTVKSRVHRARDTLSTAMEAADETR